MCFPPFPSTKTINDTTYFWACARSGLAISGSSMLLGSPMLTSLACLPKMKQQTESAALFLANFSIHVRWKGTNKKSICFVVNLVGLSSFPSSIQCRQDPSHTTWKNFVYKLEIHLWLNEKVLVIGGSFRINHQSVKGQALKIGAK